MLAASELRAALANSQQVAHQPERSPTGLVIEVVPANGAQQSEGGNAFRAVTHEVPAAPSPTTFGALWSAHFRNGAVYDPSTQGPIGSIDYAEDAKRIFGSPLGQSAGIAIRQNGMVFVAQVGTTPEDVFTRKEGKALKASSFGVLTAGGFPGASVRSEWK